MSDTIAITTAATSSSIAAMNAANSLAIQAMRRRNKCQAFLADYKLQTATVEQMQTYAE